MRAGPGTQETLHLITCGSDETGSLQAVLELLQYQLALALKRLRLDIAAFRLKRRQAGQIDEAVGNGDRVGRPPGMAPTR